MQAETSKKYDVIVVGFGIVGMSAAYHLSQSRSVAVIEQYDLDHSRGSSRGGPRRIGMVGGGRRVERAWDAWKVLDALHCRDTGAHLMEVVGEVGIISDGGWLAKVVLMVLAPVFRFWWGCRILWNTRRVKDHLPECFHFPTGAVGYYHPKAAKLNTARVAEFFTKGCRERGVQFYENESVMEVQDRGGTVLVRCKHQIYKASTVVLATGGWTEEILRSMGVEDVVTKIGLFHCPVFESTPEDSRGPIFSFVREGIYGFPSTGFDQLFVRSFWATETQGKMDRIVPEQLPIPENVANFVRTFLGGRVSSKVERCRYPKLSIGGRTGPFMEYLPSSNVIVAAGMDGYGFKYGSVYGEEIERLIESSRASEGR